MPDVTEQLRRYGDAVEQHALQDASSLGAEHSIAPRPRRRRRLVVALAAATALVVGAVGVVLAREDSPSTRAVHVVPRQGAPALVPPGWKPVTYGSVQFAVPEEWPVYDEPRCFDEPVDAVYLGGAGPGPSQCGPRSRTAIVVR